VHKFLHVWATGVRSFRNTTLVPTADIFILHSQWYILVGCEQGIPDILSFKFTVG